MPYIRASFFIALSSAVNQLKRSASIFRLQRLGGIAKPIQFFIPGETQGRLRGFQRRLAIPVLQVGKRGANFRRERGIGRPQASEVVLQPGNLGERPVERGVIGQVLAGLQTSMPVAGWSNRRDILARRMSTSWSSSMYLGNFSRDGLSAGSCVVVYGDELQFCT